jgi:SM-20-related protein
MSEAAARTDVSDDLPVIRLSPALDPRDYATTFRRDGIVQVHDFFEPAIADYLNGALMETARWQVSFPDENKGWLRFSQQQLAALGAEEVGRRWRNLLQRASTGFSYVYLAFPLNETDLTSGRSDQALKDLFRFLNSQEFLGFGREVIDQPGVDNVEASATWYRPGDFLTLHADHGGGLRRAAYTIGFTRGWRPDWGGQLLFHNESGEITRGLIPAFNVLTLFKTPQEHSVAQVASYAAAPRLVISGWLNEGAAPSS